MTEQPLELEYNVHNLLKQKAKNNTVLYRKLFRNLYRQLNWTYRKLRYFVFCPKGEERQLSIRSLDIICDFLCVSIKDLISEETKSITA